MIDLSSLLAAASARHGHLCPRQVLGVRMGLAGPPVIGLSLPARHRELLVIAETDGCFLDGLSAAAGVSPGSRTLRVQDYGKVAATFVNVPTGEAVRLTPQAGVRMAAFAYAPGATQPYAAQLAGYQLMPDEELFSYLPVALTTPLAALIGLPGVRANCAICGEEIINGREVVVDGRPYCQSCYGPSYYHAAGPAAQPAFVLIREIA